MAAIWRDDFVAAGYRPYRDSMKDQGEQHTPVADRMYQGSVQKRITDKRGTRYFVNVNLYDFTRVRNDGQDGRSQEAEVQFSIRDEMETTVNVSGVRGDTVEETEAFFTNLWHRMGWGYYEVDDRDAPSPTLSFSGDAS